MASTTSFAESLCLFRRRSSCTVRAVAPTGTLVYFYVDDVDSIAEESGQVSTAWAREIQLHDPDGNRLRIGPSAGD